MTHNYDNIACIASSIRDMLETSADNKDGFHLTEKDLEVYQFPQVWGSTALGFGGIGGQAMTKAITTVVIGPVVQRPPDTAEVYFGGRFAYRVSPLTHEFYTDLSRHRMKSIRQCGCYGAVSFRYNRYKGQP